jgi:8-oxo-dGTP pyrophosphatase MutT (NUDIX family)
MPILYRSFFKEEEDDDLPGDPFWGNTGAGVLFLARDTGRFLVFLRSDSVNEPGTWNLSGGKLDPEEERNSNRMAGAKEAAAREVEEKTGYDGEYKLKLLHIFRHKIRGTNNEFRYYNFLCIVPFEFTPQLNWEHDTSEWVDYGDWPSPLHFGLADVIRHMGPRLEKLSNTLKRKNARMSGETPNPRVVENIDDCEFINKGLVDDGIFGYEMRSKKSFISYGYDPAYKLFYLYNIMTPNEADTNKGHAKRLLEDFFQLIKQYGGALDIGPYTAAGVSYIKHVVERLSKEYNVPLVKGRNFYDRS